MTKKLACVFISILSFTCTIIILRHTANRLLSQKPDLFGAKTQIFNKNKDKYTGIFVGDSRIYRHISPEAFDQCMKNQGILTNSFNMGVPRISITETQNTLRDILKSNPKQLKYIFISPDTHFLQEKHTKTKRAIFFSSPKDTIFSIKYILNANYLNKEEKFEHIKNIVTTFTLNIFNVGELGSIIFPNNNSEKNTNYSENKRIISKLLEDDGHIALDKEKHPSFKRRRNKLLEKVNNIGWYQLIEANLNYDNSTKELSNYHRQVILNTVSVIQSHNIEPIFIISPNMRGLRMKQVITTYESGNLPLPILLDYSNYKRNQDLFEQDLWFDEGHLNSKGAKIFSCNVAKDFIKALKQ